MRTLRFKAGDLIKIKRISDDEDRKFFSVGDIGKILKVMEDDQPYLVDFNQCGPQKVCGDGFWYVRDNDIKLAGSAGRELGIETPVNTDTRSDDEKRIADLILG